MTDKKQDDSNLSNKMPHKDKSNDKKAEMADDEKNEKLLDADLEYIINEEEKLKESSHL